MVHSRVSERPSPGNAKPIIGEKYSQATAAIHSASRYSCDSPPAIQNAAEGWGVGGQGTSAGN